MNEKYYDVESYLRQFTPAQWCEAFISVTKSHANLIRIGFVLAQPDGWKMVVPFWMKEFERKGIKPLEEFRNKKVEESK